MVHSGSRTIAVATNRQGLTNEKLVDRIHQLFLEAVPKCGLSSELEAEIKDSFASAAEALHELRRDRNRILHSRCSSSSKAGGEIQGLPRSNPKIQVDEETGLPLYDQEVLTAESFSKELKIMADLAQSFLESRVPKTASSFIAIRMVTPLNSVVMTTMTILLNSTLTIAGLLKHHIWQTRQQRHFRHSKVIPPSIWP